MIRLLPFLFVWAIVAESQAKSLIHIITPKRTSAAGFNLKVSANQKKDGWEFTVVLTSKKNGRICTKPGTRLSVINIVEKPGSRSETISSIRSLKHTRKGDTLTSVFTATDPEIFDRKAYFVFANQVEYVRNGKIRKVPSIDFLC
ncbi:MAG: hypothetical protein AAF514_18970, partial [Verrucomicrobiota bacterium]